MMEEYLPKTGALAAMCKSVLNTRKMRWNKFLRECKKIPKSSPVYGSTSFKAINARRHALITESLKSDSRIQTEEERILVRCVSIAAGAYLAVNLLAGKRMVRHMRRNLQEMGVDPSPL